MLENTIDLSKPEMLPDELQNRLSEFDNLFKKYDFHENIQNHFVDIYDFDIECSQEEIEYSNRFHNLLKDINAFCESQKILGVHYTRAVPERIKEQGLLLRTGEEIRNTFLEEYSALFSSEELAELKSGWERYFNEDQKKCRDLKIYFNFILTNHEASSVKYLVSFYGGEQVTMGIDFDSILGRKLSSIGKPLIIYSALHPKNLEMTYSLGKIMISSYHCSINFNANSLDSDICQTCPVYPGDILEIQEINGI